jgi:histidine triad (HIT) family protein
MGKPEPGIMSNECVFCEIMAGRAPGDVIYQDDLTVAFIDPRQYHPGHVLVVPRKHINDIRELDPTIGARLMNTLIRIARAVDRAFPSEGMSVWHSVGPAAFQEIPHMHPLMRMQRLVPRTHSACARHFPVSRLRDRARANPSLHPRQRQPCHPPPSGFSSAWCRPRDVRCTHPSPAPRHPETQWIESPRA